MSRIEVPGLALSCWIIEAARSDVLAQRGHSQAAVRAAERARILARACAAEGIKILPRVAGEHGEWMGRVAGSDEETGVLGRVFLQRLGMYVDAYIKAFMPAGDHQRLLQLTGEDLDEVNEAMSEGRLPDIPEDDWPPPPDGPGAGASSSLRFGILADPHIQRGENPFVEQVLESLRRADVAFTVVPGDVTIDGATESFATAERLLGRASTPVLVTLGNHDTAASAQIPGPEAPAEPPEAAASSGPSDPGGHFAPGLARFEAAFRTKPYGVHEFDGVRVIVLDSAVPATSPFPPFDILGGDFTEAPPGSAPWGDFSEEVSDWMSALGPSPETTFIFLHHPPYPYPGFPPLVFGLGKEATEKLAGLVQSTGAEAVFCGHTHRSAHRLFEGIPLIEVPAVVHWPFAFAVVEVGGSGADEGGWWSFNLHPLPDRPKKAKDHAGYLFRRYVAGDKTGHALVQRT